jgi:hypothetical protein
MNINNIIDWFGNRGVSAYDMPINNKTKYKIVNDWLFIDNKEYQEVELYYLNTIYCEAYNGWNNKTFDWSNKNLLKQIELANEY